LVDSQGLPWGSVDRPLAAYQYPTTHWKPGQVTLSRVPLPAQAGTPPGEYLLEVRLYRETTLEGLNVLDGAGAPQGQVVVIGPVLIEPAGLVYVGEAFSVSHALEQTWEDSITLHGVGPLAETVQVGESVVVELVWSCTEPTAQPLVGTLRLTSRTPAAHTPIESPVTALSRYPTDRWRAGEWLRTQDIVSVPASWVAGPADLTLRVSLEGEQLGPDVLLGTIAAIVPPRDFTAPSPQIVSAARTENGIHLLGLSPEPSIPQVGEPYAVTLYWQPDTEVGRSYTVFVQLLDESGKVIAQHDRLPADGTRPTTGWVAGEVITDRYEFEALPPGAVVLGVGLYDGGQPSMPRLMWLDSDGNTLGDALRFSLR